MEVSGMGGGSTAPISSGASSGASASSPSASSGVSHNSSSPQSSGASKSDSSVPAANGTGSPSDSSRSAADSGSEGMSKAEEKRWRLKTKNSGEKEYDEATVTRYAQKGMYADELIESNALIQKKWDAFQEGLKTDPVAAIKALAKQTGFSTAEIAESLLGEHLEEQFKEHEEKKLTPEQRKARDDAKRLEEYERRDAEARTETEKQAYTAKKAEAKQKVLGDIKGALDSVGFLSGEGEYAEALRDEAVADAAQYLLQARRAGIEVQTGDIADHVKSMAQERIGRILEAADESSFGDFLPEAFVKRVGKYYANKLRGGNNPSRSASTPGTPAKNPASERPLKYSELMRQRNQ